MRALEQAQPAPKGVRSGFLIWLNSHRVDVLRPLVGCIHGCTLVPSMCVIRASDGTLYAPLVFLDRRVA